ncbi:hypothetical protein E2C01_077927 [Portunus trituberculatus]|uniref:Uncharacterized protein n=1 Tax=Portunus trituberculatus TaxID=210409 RepID=A0A5B7ILD0_PORTR|nr:hypothetical protein [Portunus trituberculatus]
MVTRAGRCDAPSPSPPMTCYTEHARLRGRGKTKLDPDLEEGNIRLCIFFVFY